MPFSRVREYDDSPLLRAILNGQEVESILTMIDHDPAAVRCQGTYGDYPLHVACCYQKDEENQQFERVIMKLLDIFPHAARKKNNEGNYALQIACRNGKSKDVILQLIKIFPKAVANKSSYFDMYALHLACVYLKSVAVIKKLVAIYPAALHYKNSFHSMYPIHHAIENDQSLEVIKLFVNTDPSILQQIGEYDRTPFHYACCKNMISVVQYLLPYAFPYLQINAKDRCGDTPLHDTCRCGYIEIVEMLLQHPDIHVNVTNDIGNTPLHVTVRGYSNSVHDCLDVVRLLLQHPSMNNNAINDANDNNETSMDIINHRILELADSNYYNKDLLLPYYIDIKRLLEDFSTQRKWQAYECMFRSM